MSPGKAGRMASEPLKVVFKNHSFNLLAGQVNFANHRPRYMLTPANVKLWESLRQSRRFSDDNFPARLPVKILVLQ